MRRGLLGLACALVAAGAAPSTALGAGFDFLSPVGLQEFAPADLDPSFSEDGIGRWRTTAVAVARQADGKFVTAGESNNDFIVERFNADGSLDTSFSGDGRQITDFFNGRDEGIGVAVQADGKIVVAGSVALPNEAPDFGIARYNSDGSPDTSFSGDGRQTADISPIRTRAEDVAIQADGKLVVVGGVDSSTFALARFTVNGALDPTFSGDGLLNSELGVAATAVTTQPDGKLVVTGFGVVARYNGDGSLDTSFSRDGVQYVAFDSEDVAVQSDGRIVVGGGIFEYQAPEANAPRDFALARLLPNGALDPSFSGDGWLTTSLHVGRRHPRRRGPVQRQDRGVRRVRQVRDRPLQRRRHRWTPASRTTAWCSPRSETSAPPTTA